MSIVRLKDNHSMRVSLKYISPVRKLARNGNGYEYLYTLLNGDGIYVSAQGREEIDRLRPQAAEPFMLAKIVGSGDAVEWRVERIESRKDSESHADAHKRIYGNEKPAPKPVAAARSISSAPGVPIPPSLTTPESQRMFKQLVATIEAVKAAEEFSVSIGRTVQFAPEDIRANGDFQFDCGARTESEGCMTFHQFFEERLVSMGMFPEQAQTVLKYALLDKTLDAMQGRWGHDVSGYPTPLLLVVWLAIQRIALTWIDAELPKAWYRPLFTEGLESTAPANPSTAAPNDQPTKKDSL